MRFSQRFARFISWPAAALAAIVLLGASLRLLPLTESLWLDELHTAWCSLAGLDEVSQFATLGNQSPLFFWLEWLLVRVCGPSEWSLRLPSFLAGAALPLALYIVARRWTTAGVALTAAAIIAIDPLAIFYATEARPYALVQLFSVVHVGLTVKLLVQPSRLARISWILLAAIIFHLHYTAGLLIVAEVVGYCVAITACPSDVTYGWRSALLDLALTAGLCLLAAGNLSAIFARRANWAEFVPQSDVRQAAVWWPTAVGGLYLLAAMFTGRKASVPSVIAICWAAVPVLLAWLVTEIDFARLFYPRYLVVVPPAAAILAAWCIDLATGRLSKLLLGTTLVIAATLTGGVPQRLISDGQVIEPRNEDWRGAIAWLNDQLQEQPLPVLVSSGLIEGKEHQRVGEGELDDYLLLPVTSLYPLDVDRNEMAPLVLTGVGQLNPTVEMLALHRGGAWLVIRGNDETAELFALALCRHLERPRVGDGSSWQLGSRWSSEKVQVISIRSAVIQPAL